MRSSTTMSTMSGRRWCVAMVFTPGESVPIVPVLPADALSDAAAAETRLATRGRGSETSDARSRILQSAEIDRLIDRFRGESSSPVYRTFVSGCEGPRHRGIA